MIRASGAYQEYVRKERKSGRLNDKYYQAMNYEYSQNGKKI